ncbi:MAG: ferrous iron transport protein A [Fimbriimonadales bacterium]|nr:ferrous iron transport protein A [Fimbriimonadales bacterium]
MDQEFSGLGAAEAAGDGAGRAIPLTQLPTGTQARIVRVVHDHDGHWRKLSALGITPGATLYLQQRFPTYALRVGLSTLAVDTQLAKLIYVEPL